MQSSVALLPMICAINIAQSPTVDRTSSLPIVVDPLMRVSSRGLAGAYDAATATGVATTVTAPVDRETTEAERIAGELRRWRLLPADWDGEGASAPNSRSIAEAVAFLALVSSENLPEPMLHPSGRAGLFWKVDDLYADLEFLGDGQLAYYVERSQGKHKGVVNFDKIKMPPVLEALI